MLRGPPSEWFPQTPKDHILSGWMDESSKCCGGLHGRGFHRLRRAKYSVDGWKDLRNAVGASMGGVSRDFEGPNTRRMDGRIFGMLWGPPREGAPQTPEGQILSISIHLSIFEFAIPAIDCRRWRGMGCPRCGVNSYLPNEGNIHYKEGPSSLPPTWAASGSSSGFLRRN